ncbi:expressed unknown protein [Seminavis robusta]|uniref:Uncharacterized protein n=1 Tax=Seminavis robusta TaxID=568900 RepID=A0A9N8F0J6_9STRA|nr:expressed unknown protein [Seminavis robusta]|eukprot:Sro2885_g339370.1 n/a (177) ;mRNA; f:7998-8528
MMFTNDFPFEINDELMVVQDEELSATSNEEANMVFAQWKADDDMDEIMQLDEQIGSNLLDDSIFGGGDPCLSPTGPVEELVFMDQENQEKFLLPSLDGPTQGINPKLSSDDPLQERYQAHIRKLAESMKRSQETRRSLTLKTPNTNQYSRSSNVHGVLNSIEQSSRQLQQQVLYQL